MGKFVIVESPFAGDTEENVNYARAALKDCLLRGEIPFASHLLYTQVLDDKLADERLLGISAGLEMGDRMDMTVVYDDMGISDGMAQGIWDARMKGRPVEYRSILPRADRRH